MIASMIDTFRTRFGLSDDALRSEDLARAGALIRDKFGQQRWTGIVP